MLLTMGNLLWRAARGCVWMGGLLILAAARARLVWLAIACLGGLAWAERGSPGSVQPEPSESRLEAYAARRPKSILDLQLFQQAESIEALRASGERGEATLIGLQPRVNAWLLLKLVWPGEHPEPYHVENADPDGQEVRLEPRFPLGVVLRSGRAEERCDLWSDPASGIAAARRSGLPYAPLCGGRLYLRNPAGGRKTRLEWATDLLRDYVPGGERITVFVRQAFFRDAFRSTSGVFPAKQEEGRRDLPGGVPQEALVVGRFDGHALTVSDLGIRVVGGMGGALRVGRWYAVEDAAGIFVSAIQPGLVAPSVIESQVGRVNPLDPVEAEAMVYLVAFDLSRFELGLRRCAPRRAGCPGSRARIGASGRSRTRWRRPGR